MPRLMKHVSYISGGFLKHKDLVSHVSFLGPYVICNFIKLADVYIRRLKLEVFLKSVLMLYHFIINKQSHSQGREDNIETAIRFDNSKKTHEACQCECHKRNNIVKLHL